MQTRTPAVAGMFYPGEKKELRKSIRECFLLRFGPGKIPPSDIKKKIFGVICPHAGYMYSGPIACHSFYAIKNYIVASAGYGKNKKGTSVKGKQSDLIYAAEETKKDPAKK